MSVAATLSASEILCSIAFGERSWKRGWLKSSLRVMLEKALRFLASSRRSLRFGLGFGGRFCNVAALAFGGEAYSKT